MTESLEDQNLSEIRDGFLEEGIFEVSPES